MNQVSLKNTLLFARAVGFWGSAGIMGDTSLLQIKALGDGEVSIQLQRETI